MFKRLMCFVLLALSTISMAREAEPAQRSATVIAKVLSIEYPPFVSESMPKQGLAFAILRKRLEGSTITVAPSFLPPARVQQIMVGKDWDASFVPYAGESKSVVRLVLQEADFVFGLFRARQTSAFKWNQLSELAGKRVALTRSLKPHAYNPGLLENDIQLVFIDDISQGFRMLAYHRVDYVLAVKETGWYLMDALNMSKDDYQFSESEIARFPYMIYINKATREGQALLQALTANAPESSITSH